MSMTTPFPEPDSPDLERFAIYARAEIATLLREVSQRQVLVTLYYEQGSGFAVSNVLEVNAAFEELIFDCAADSTSQAAVYAARELVAVAFLDNVKLQFTVGGAEAIRYRGRPAFRVRLPQQMLRLQRRSHRRQQTPPHRPATCLVPVLGEEGKFESLHVLDLSVGGLAMLAHPTQFEPPTDRELRPCYLDLPEVGQITVALRVRYVDRVSDGDSPRRCGCEFVDLSSAATRMLQRYMNKLDAACTGAGDKRAA